MDLSNLAKGLIWIGVILAAIGVGLLVTAKLGIPLGKLPGDFQIRGERWSFYFPLMTCVVLSIVLTVILNILVRLFK